MFKWFLKRLRNIVRSTRTERRVARRNQRYASPPRLENLENRLAPATYNWNGTSTLSLSLGTGESLSVAQQGASPNLTFTLSGGASTWSATGTTTDGTNSTNQLTFLLNADIATSFAINNTGASAGTNNVTFASGTVTSGTINVSIVSPATSGTISETAGILSTAGTLTTASIGGTTLNSAGNAISAVNASNSTGGNISLTNTIATLSVAGLTEVAAGTATINNTGAVTFPNALSGGFNLSDTSSGLTTFSAAVGSSTALASVAITNATAINGGSVTTSGSQTYSGNVTLGATTNLTHTGASSLSIAGTTLSLGTFTLTDTPATSSASTGTISAQITGTGGLTENGPGALTLSGNNTFSGTGVTINGGILQLNNAGALNSTTPNSVTFGASSTGDLQLNGKNVTVSGLSTNATVGTPIVENANATAATLTVSVPGSNTFAGVARDGVGGGALSLLKSGTGTLTLSGANTYSGGTTVSQGTLVLASDTAAGPFTSSITLGDANTGANNIALQFSGTFTSDLTVRGSVVVRRFAPINVTANGSGTDTLTFSNGGVFIDTDVTMNRATIFAGGSSRGLLGQLKGPGAGAGNDTVIIDPGAGTTFIYTAKDDGTNSFANTFTGNVHVKTGTWQMQNLAYTGNVAANQNLVIPDTSSITVDTNAIWQLTHGVETVDGFNGGGTIQNNATNYLPGTATLTVGANNSGGTFSGNMKDNGVAFSFAKAGTGTETLSGTTNTYTGGTTIAAGTLQVGANNALPTGTTVTFGTSTTNGTLDLGGFNQQVGGLTVAAGATAASQFIGNSSTTANSTLTFSGGTSTFAGVIKDVVGSGTKTVALTVSAGSLTLTGANTYTGTTSITAGTLLVNNTTGSGTGTNSVTASGTGTLGGTGTISGTVNVNSGGSITGGTVGTVGTLTVGSLAFNGGTYKGDVSGNTSDTIAISTGGTVNLKNGSSGIFSFNNLGGTTSAGTVFTFISNNAAGATAILNPPLTNAAEGFVTPTFNGVTAAYSYLGGPGGKNFTLSVVSPLNISAPAPAGGAVTLKLDSTGKVLQEIQGGTVLSSTPLNAISSIIYTDSNVGTSNTLIVDYSNGFFTQSVTYAGNSVSGEKLVVTGGTFNTVTHTFNTTGPGKSGTILYDTTGGGITTDLITYSGLTPINQAGSTIGNLVFNLPTGGTSALLGDDGTPGNGISQISNTAGSAFETTTFANPTNTLTINRGGVADTLAIAALPDFTAGLTVGSAGNALAAVSLNGTFTLNTGTAALAVTASSISATAGTETAGSVNLTGTGTLPGNSIGININGATVQSSTGNISLQGTGGNSGSANFGVEIQGGGVVKATSATGTVTIQGTGGASSGSQNDGVIVTGSGSLVTSGGGNVQVTGQGGGISNGSANFGVFVQSGGLISAGGTGTVTVMGTAGATSGGNDAGVVVSISGSQVTSSGGNVQITGLGASSGTGNGGDDGVNVVTGGKVTAGGTGTVTIMGTAAANDTGGVDEGVVVFGTGSLVSSNNGNVQVTGQGGGTASSGSNDGVELGAGGKITAGGATTSVTVMGTGGGGSGSDDFGVLVTDAGTQITSGGGNVQVTGLGGGAGAGGINDGVEIAAAGTITAGGATSTVTVMGTGGGTGGQDVGVEVTGNNSTLTSSGGNVSVTGVGGGTGASNPGVEVDTGGTITAGGTGTVTVKGTGGANPGGSDTGVLVINSSATITSGGGNVSVTGIGGGAVGGGTNTGVEVDNTGTITAGSTGTVTVMGTGGTNDNIGIDIGVSMSGAGAIITSGGGNVSVTGIGGGTGSTGSNFGIALGSSTTISAGGTGTVTVNGTGGSTTAVNENGVLLFGAGAQITSTGGNISVTGQAGGTATTVGIQINGSTSVTAPGANSVTLTGTGATTGDISISGTVSSTTGPITATAGKNIAFGSPAGNVTTSTSAVGANVTLTASSTGTITEAGTNTTVTGNVLSLTAGGGIGTASNPIVLSGTSLTTDSSAGISNQFLKNAGAAITVTFLNAGTPTTPVGLNPPTNGTITLVGGTFTDGSGNGIANGSALTVNTPAVFNLTAAGETIGSLAGTGTVNLNTSTLITGGNNATTTFSGTIDTASDSGALTKTGTGAFRLAAAGTYNFTGVVNVNGGVLVEDGTLAVGGTNAVTVNIGGTLGGSGTLNRPLVVQSGGTVSPGDSASTLSSNPTTPATAVLHTGTGGNATFATGSTFFVDLLPGAVGSQPVAGTNYDQLDVTGTIVLNGTVNLNGTNGANPIGSKFTIVLNHNGAPAVTGLFGNTPEGGFINVGGVIYNITYEGNNHNDVVLTLPGRFDFGTATSPVDTTDGYQQVTNNTLSGGANAFGWAVAPLAVDRGTPAQPTPNNDLNYSSNADSFSVTVVQAGIYRVTVTVGDAQVGHDNVVVTFPNATAVTYLGSNVTAALGGASPDIAPTTTTNANLWLTNPIGQFITATYDVNTGASTTLAVNFSKPAIANFNRDPNWAINAMDIRPDYTSANTSVAPLSLQRTLSSDGTAADATATAPPAPLGAPNSFPTTLISDGLSIDTYTGTGTAPNAFITVSSTFNGRPFGTVLTAQDVDPNTAGVQVQANGSGQFTFQVMRPTGTGPGIIQAYERSGLEYGVASQPYTLPTTRHISFDGGNPAVTAPGYLGIGPVVYSSTAANALGWVNTSANYFSYSTPNKLLQAFAYGTNNTFQLDLPNGGTGTTVYEVSATMGDPMYQHDMDDILASVNGGSFASVLGGTLVSNVPGQFPVVTFTVTASGAINGTSNIDLQFLDRGGSDPNFVLNALDVQPAANQFGALTLAHTTVGSTQAAIASGASFTTETGDGTTDTYQLSGVPALAKFTVTVSGATLNAADTDANIAGIQIQSTAGGVATFAVVRPTGATSATFTINEVTPQSIPSAVTYSQLTGSFTQPYSSTGGGSPVVAYNFAFNTPAFPPTEVVGGINYTSVPGSAYASATGFGWTTPIQNFSYSTPNALLEAFNYSTSGTFRVDLPNGTYQVTATMGDPAYLHDQEDIRVSGNGAAPVSVLGGNLVSNNAGQWTSTTYNVTVSGGNPLLQQFVDLGGRDPNFVLNALNIRPIASVQGITFALTATGSNNTNDPGDTTGADGITVDTYTGTIAGASLANKSITVTTSLGTVVGVDNGSGVLTAADNNNLITGQQAIVEGTNTFQFKVRRPTLAGSLPVFTATEVTGLATGSATASGQSAFTVAKVRQFDFISPGAPVTPLTIGALPTDQFATTGYGWTVTPIAYDRGASAGVGTTLESFHYGSFSDNFQLQVVSGTTYSVKVYLGDSGALHDNVQVTVGAAAPYVVTTQANQFNFTVTTVAATSGTLLINLQDLGGLDPNWVVDGLDITAMGSTTPPQQPQMAASVLGGGGAAKLTQAELAPVAAEAVRRLAASGLNTTQVAELKAATFVIQTNLSLTTGALGLTALGSEVVTLDATGAGYGWYIDATAGNDNAFRQQVSTNELKATDAAALSHYDLLTVVMHELEHVIRVSDVSASVSPHTLMTDTLQLGVRRLPAGATPVYTTAQRVTLPKTVAAQTVTTTANPMFNGISPDVALAILDNNRRTEKQTIKG